ncbi:uncharacterized protein LOC18432867 isoform X1 [Amborella trichopoda]|uniref:uncharacterized protein LOC18432867 isoform X1 n=2 Tax=Amborella trichopoda TaxID=13333 RepID=UPI0005D2F3E7|nr:uncharacterized protein LOC18432867 isoform X1 [Amborella trichopoda]|eukprot:XP_011622864.1 uncharacterized protein LOC18432867 isoform X1 [Amborella trichopoda]
MAAVGLCQAPAFTIALPKKEAPFRSLSPAFQYCKCGWNPIRASALSDNASRGSRKPKARKSVKSNIDLCKELQDFITMAGLPSSHIPSMKELSQFGRQDLANIVRRRGYKLITMLLTEFRETNINSETDSEENIEESSENQFPGREALLGNFSDGVSTISSEDFSVENRLSSHIGVSPQVRISQFSETESSINSHLHEKASTFIQTSELETAEEALDTRDSGICDNLELSIGSSDAGRSKSHNELFDECLVESTFPINEDAARKANQTTSDGKQESVSLIASELYTPRKQSLPSDRPKDNGFIGNDVATEPWDRDSQDEIDRLKALLSQKELELLKLKQQIESEKATLTSFETKSTTEIDNAKRLITEMDAILHVADGNLSGLKEVQIEYWGNAGIVEVAGSFNGWQLWIKMQPDSSPEITNKRRSRVTMKWSAILWLYPGIYELDTSFNNTSQYVIHFGRHDSYLLRSNPGCSTPFH